MRLWWIALVVSSACRDREAPSPRDASPPPPVPTASSTVDATSEAATACDPITSSRIHWAIVQDRKVTAIESGVYPMLWLQSSVEKMWSRFWLPKENAALPRLRKFVSCALVPPAERIDFPPHTLSAIHCVGAVPMDFAAVASSDG